MIVNASADGMPLRDGLVHTIVTSPPYHGLRAYSGLQNRVWVGGAYAPVIGAPACMLIPGPTTPAELDACDHVWGEALPGSHPGQVEQTKWASAEAAGKGQTANSGRYCQRCGAWRGGFGSESTIEMYIWHSLLILRECRRVLRADGVVWWNMGDAYMSAKGRYKNGPQTLKGKMDGLPWEKVDGRAQGWTDGQLVGAPHRLMLAAQADGWTVRNDVVWAKRSPMPESVSGWRYEQQTCECVDASPEDLPKYAGRMEQGLLSAKSGLHTSGHASSRGADLNCPLCHGAGVVGDPAFVRGSWRHTRSHEFVLMLTKGMGYYANAELSKETADTEPGVVSVGVRNPRNVMTLDVEAEIAAQVEDFEFEFRAALAQRTNVLDVVRPAPSNYSGAHYAVFPPELIAPLIRATTPKRSCPQCGQGWSPVVDRKESSEARVVCYRPSCACHYGSEFLPDDFERVSTGESSMTHYEQRRYAAQLKASPHRRVMEAEAGKTAFAHYLRTDRNGARPIPPALLDEWIEWGWLERVVVPPEPEPLPPVPGIVLDPFFGSGTTGMVARELGVRYIGLDISYVYLHQQAQVRAARRTPKSALKDLPMFAESE